jgi:hypothetical protein
MSANGSEPRRVDPRAEVLAVQQQNLRAEQQRESARARALLAEGVAAFRAAGVGPVRLTARTWSGRSRVRTALTGWYLKQDRSIAVGEDGEYYVLSVQGTPRERLRGARPVPSDPPLVVGRGGRDGDAIDLADLLAARLTDPVR